MKRNYNYWSGKGTTETKETKKVEAPKVKYSICTKESLIGVYCDDENNIIPTDYFEDLSIGCLEILVSLLENIPTNDTIAEEISIIYVPDIIGALVTGGIADYLRTNKTKSGDSISQEKLDLYIEIDNLVKERNYNVILRGYGFQDKTFQAKAIAWIKEEVRDATAKANGKEREPRGVVSSVNPAIENLNNKIMELISEGKYDEADKVAKILASITGKAEPVIEEEKAEA